VVITTITVVKGAVKESIAEAEVMKDLSATLIQLDRARVQSSREDRIKVATTKIIKNPKTTTRKSSRLVLRHLQHRNSPQIMAMGKGTEEVEGKRAAPSPSPAPSSPSPALSTTITFTTTTLPPLPRSTVAIVTVVPAPTPSTSTPPPPPEATCTAVSDIQSVELGIGTNFVTDNGEALQDQANKKCYCAHLSKWSVQDSSKSYTAADGTAWLSNQLFQFMLDVTHPQQVACLKEAVVAAGGQSNTPKCDFAPLLNPPKRRGR